MSFSPDLRPTKKYIHELEHGDIVEINAYIGPMPNVSQFKRMRILMIKHCIITNPHSHPLPDWIEHLSIDCTKIGELPSLPSRLNRLCVEHTDITELPTLPPTLTQLSISNNPSLTELPLLPAGLTSLCCPRNRLRSLPCLPSKIFSLACFSNCLEDLPPLPPNLIFAEISGNPFKFMPYKDIALSRRVENPLLQTKLFQINAIHRFREAYYCAKCGPALKRWLWRAREQQAIRQCNPAHLKKCLEYIPDDMLEYATDVIFSLKDGFVETSRRFESEFQDSKSIIQSSELVQKILEDLANGHVLKIRLSR